MKKMKYLLFSFSTFIVMVGSAQQRIVLLEDFTNSGCPTCAASTPQVMQYVDNNSTDIVAIAYHTLIPHLDSMYYENIVESDARVQFYGVVGVPYSIVDGNVYQNSSANFLPVMASVYNARLAVNARYSIINEATSIAGNQLSGTLVFQSEDANNNNDSLRAMIVVIEKQVQKSSYAASPGGNTETVYKYVMRKMLPDATGNYLQNRNLSGTDTIHLNWNMQHIKSINEVRVVAFVQNISTKEVYQSVLINPIVSTGVSENEEESMNLTVFPNPSSGLLTVEWNETLANATFEITDVTGKRIKTGALKGAKRLEITTENIAKGLYFFSVKANGQHITKKIIVN